MFFPLHVVGKPDPLPEAPHGIHHRFLHPQPPPTGWHFLAQGGVPCLDCQSRQGTWGLITVHPAPFISGINVTGVITAVG